MNPIALIKIASEVVVSLGVGTIVGNVVRATTPENVKGVKKVGILVGSMVLGAMASKKAVEFVNEQIDEVAENVENAKKAAKGELTESKSDENEYIPDFASDDYLIKKLAVLLAEDASGIVNTDPTDDDYAEARDFLTIIKDRLPKEEYNE